MSEPNYLIKHITEIKNIIDSLEGYIMAAFDWDNCISLTDGCNLPLRDPITDDLNGSGDQVLEFFDYLNKINIPWFIITARLKGRNEDYYFNDTAYLKKYYFNSYIISEVHSMMEALPPLHLKNRTQKVMSPEIIKHISYKDPDLPPYINHSIRYHNIIFAGGRCSETTNKGPVLIYYIRHDIIPNNFDYFLFIDNDIKHINSVISSFTQYGLRDKLIAIYYPQNPYLIRQLPIGTSVNYKIGPCIQHFPKR